MEILLLKGADPDVTDKVSAGQWWLYWPLSYIPICILLVIDDAYVYLEVHRIVSIMIHDDVDCDQYDDDDDDIGDDAFWYWWE